MTNENNQLGNLFVKYNYITSSDLDLDAKTYPAVNQLFKIGHYCACLKVLLNVAKTQEVSLETALLELKL